MYSLKEQNVFHLSEPLALLTEQSVVHQSVFHLSEPLALLTEQSVVHLSELTGNASNCR